MHEFLVTEFYSNPRQLFCFSVNIVYLSGVVVCNVTRAEVETVRSNLNTLIKEGLGPRAEKDFLLARDTCLALLKLTTKVCYKYSFFSSIRSRFLLIFI